jgi:hypothetical protein
MGSSLRIGFEKKNFWFPPPNSSGEMPAEEARQDYFLKTKNNVRKNSKRFLQASYLHDKALQTLFRGDNRVSKLYNCSNKPVNASECNFSLSLFEYTPTFILYHQHMHVGVDYLIIVYYAEYWGGVKIFLRGGHFAWGGGYS